MTKRSCKARLFPSVLLPAFLLAVSLLPAFARSSKTPSKSESIRALNNSVLRVHGQMQRTNANEARLLRSQAGIAIAKRQAVFSQLIQSDPRSALSFAFSPELLADLAAKFPRSAALLESHVTLTGEAQHWIADYPGLRSSKSIWQMNVAGRTVALYFANHEPSNLKPGQSLQVHGVIAGDLMAVEASLIVPQASANRVTDSGVLNALDSRVYCGSGLLMLVVCGLFGVRCNPTGSRKRLAPIGGELAIFGFVIFLSGLVPIPIHAQNSCSTKGVQNSAVLLVNLPNGLLPSGVTQSSVQDVFFASNTAGVSVDGFLRAASYGQASVAGDVLGPFNLTGTYSSCSDLTAIQNDAIASAMASGANLTSYTRLFLVFPDVLGCGWAGYTSNSCSISTPSGTFNASLTNLAARYVTPRATGVEVASHEFGHNLGLLHSGNLSGGTEPLGPISAPGTWTDQGDYWSVMGETVMGLYPAPQKAEVMGWMTSGVNYQSVQSSGSYTLQPLEIGPAGMQALKVQRGTGNNAWLWIEYRQPLGAYDSLLWAQPFNGALIHYEDSNTETGHTYLPNFTPSDTTGRSPALAAGQTWTDPYSNLSIAVVSATSSGLTVNVNYGSVPCGTTNPIVGVTPANPSIYAGASTAYAISVQNNDSSGCAPSTFDISSSQPSGWGTTFSANSVTVNAGQAGKVTMYKAGPSGTTPGTYAVDAKAVNGNNSGGATANITVMGAPSLTGSLAIPSSTYVRQTTVPITMTVLNGGVPVAGANVTFILTNPNGNANSQSAITGSNGTATWNYKTSTRSLTGTYAVGGRVSLTTGTKKTGTTLSATSNATSFSLQ